MVPDLTADQSVFPLWIPGYCPICEHPTAFEASGPWYRDTLTCPSCRSVVRERALAMVLNDLRPDWRQLAVHEAAPLERAISPKLRSEAPRYVATQYYPQAPFGSMVNGVRNENLEAQTFGDGSFDIVITLDVMEHVLHPDRVYAEIFRTLKDGGVYIHTFPIRRDLMESHRRRVELLADGSLRHLEEPEYHGNPVDLTGSLVRLTTAMTSRGRSPPGRHSMSR